MLVYQVPQESRDQHPPSMRQVFTWSTIRLLPRASETGDRRFVRTMETECMPSLCLWVLLNACNWVCLPRPPPFSWCTLVQRMQFNQSDDRVREHEEAKLRLQREVELIREREAKFAEERSKLQLGGGKE